MRVAIDGRKIRDFGIGTYIRGLLSGFASIDSGDEFIVFAPADAEPLLPRDPRFRLVEENAAHYSVEEVVRVGKRIAEVKPDVFHAPHYVVPMTPVPIVTTIHDLIHLQFPPRNPVARLYAHAMIRRAVRNSRVVLTVSAAVREAIAARYSGSREKIVVTPNGVDASFYATPDADDAAILSRLSITAERYFLFVGNDKPHKNVDLLLRAFGTSLAAGEEMPLVIAGASFDRLAGTRGVVRSGFVSERELAALYRNARALVLPSLYEGFGLPALEAMAAGTAVIASRGGGISEVVGDAALKFDATNERELLAQINLLVRDENLRASLREKGRARSLVFTWDDTARRTLDAYARAKIAS